MIEAVIGIMIGLVFVLFPHWALNTVGLLIGLLVAVYGVVLLLNGIMAKSNPMILLGALLLAVGAVVACSSSGIFMWILVIVGVLLIFRGVLYMQRSLGMRSAGYQSWWTHMIAAALILALGLCVVWNPFYAKNIAVILLGVCLIVNGVEGLVMRHLIERVIKKRAKKKDRIYVDSEEPKTR